MMEVEAQSTSVPGSELKKRPTGRGVGAKTYRS